MKMKSAPVYFVLAALSGLFGRPESSVAQTDLIQASMKGPGTFIIRGQAAAVMKCAFWHGAGQDAIMLSYNKGNGAIIGPGGWKATFKSVRGGRTQVIVQDRNGHSNANLNRKMKRWLRGCP